MKFFYWMGLGSTFLIFCFASQIGGAGVARADQVPVQFREGSAHGLFLLRSLNGKEIGNGDLTETVDGDRVTSDMALHFNDGSLYEETTVFTQGGKFRVVSYHTMQKGPSFKQAMEMTVDAEKGTVTARLTDDRGKDRVYTSQMKIPADVANGIVPYLVKNLASGSVHSSGHSSGNSEGKTTVSMIAATPKPRLVQLTITSQGLENFAFDGSKRQATRYAVQVNLGGITGPLAKVAGKQPPDSFLWVLRSKVPMFLMAQETFAGGPVCRIELATPLPPADQDGKSGN
jgi:hypothetical protein